jgi:hypothetical protein
LGRQHSNRLARVLDLKAHGFDFFDFEKDNIGSNKSNQQFVGINQNDYVDLALLNHQFKFGM